MADDENLETQNNFVKKSEMHEENFPNIKKMSSKVFCVIENIPYRYGNRNYPFFDNGNAFGTVLDISSSKLLYDNNDTTAVEIESYGINFSSGLAINHHVIELTENKNFHTLQYKYDSAANPQSVNLNDTRRKRIAEIYGMIRRKVGLPEKNKNSSSGIFGKLRKNSFLIFLICVVAFGFFVMHNDKNDSGKSNPKTPPKTTASTSPEHSSPKESTAQKNKVTPPIKPIERKNVFTGYDPDKPILNDDGLCELTIDNTRNDMPVYVRVWDMDIRQPVRAFYIAKGEEFTAYDLSPGTYEVRYIELYDNDFPARGSKSEQFELEQRDTDYGIQYSRMSLTLYKVVNGNTRTTSIPADEI